MHHLVTLAATLAYTIDGPINAPVLVLSNSLGTDHTLWDKQLPAFAARFRVLRYDARGHGQSSMPDGPYRIADLGRDVLALLDALGLGRVHFCGLSMGGLVGQWLALHAPERLHRLVLCNTAAKIATAEAWNARIDQVQREGLGSLCEGVAARWFTPDFRAAQPAAAARVMEVFGRTPPAGYAACCAAVRDADFRTRLAAVGTPTLVVAGAADAATTVAEATELQAAIPGAQLVVLEAAHLSNQEAACPFTAAVLGFLTA